MGLIILEGKVDVSVLDNPPIGSLLLAYDIDGTLKQKDENGVISSVSGSLPLSDILGLGNYTGTNSIILNTGSSIKSQVGNTNFLLDNGNVLLSTSGTSFLDNYLFMSPSGDIILNSFNRGNISLTSNSTRLSWFNSNINSLSIASASMTLLLSSRKVLEFGNGINSGSGTKLPSIISSESSTISSGVTNTVVLGGSGIIASRSNSVYLDNIYIKSGVVRNTQSSNTLNLNKFGETFIDSQYGVIGIVDGHTVLTKNGVIIYDTDHTTTSSSPNLDSNIVYVGSRNSTGLQNIKNSVVIGGVNVAALNSNTVYLGNSVNINNRYTLPSIDGISGQLLKTDGLGNVSWGTIDGQGLTLTGLTVSGAANFTSLSFNYLTLLGLTAGTASFSSISVPYLNITGITSSTASFTNLSVSSGSFSNLYVDSLNVGQLSSDSGIFVNSLTSSSIRANTLNATSSNILNLNATSSNILNLNVTSLTSSNISFGTMSGNIISVGNILSNNSTIISLTVSGTMSINRLASLPSNNNATKLLGLSGSQLVEVSSLGYTPESNANKQNSLLFDGTGQKYPTVDAVNDALSIKRNGSYIYSASQSVINHIGGTNSTLLTNNGLGLFTISYPPYGMTNSIWNSSTNRFDFTSLSIGDMINIQVDMRISSSSTDQEIEIYLVLGEGSLGEYNLTYANGGLLKRNATYPFVANSGILINNTYVRDNPAKLIFKSTSNSTINVKGWYITVSRY